MCKKIIQILRWTTVTLNTVYKPVPYTNTQPHTQAYTHTHIFKDILSELIHTCLCSQKAISDDLNPIPYVE